MIASYIPLPTPEFAAAWPVVRQSREFIDEPILYLEAMVGPNSGVFGASNLGSSGTVTVRRVGNSATFVANLDIANISVWNFGSSVLPDTGARNFGTTALGIPELEWPPAPARNIFAGNSGTITVGGVELENVVTYAVANFNIGPARNIFVGNSGTIALGGVEPENAVTFATADFNIATPRDPWLVATWDLIADHRNLAPGWDGINAVAPKREWLDAAEALAIQIAEKPMRSRPQFSVDCNGRPNFSVYDERLYLHLTIDEPNRLSWYAVSGGIETFEDDIVFDGTQLPPQLDQLL